MLIYSKTSELKEPKGKMGNFLKENWGDYLVKGRQADARNQIIWCSTYFKAKIDQMLQKQWDTIFENAEKFISKKKGTGDADLH